MSPFDLAITSQRVVRPAGMGPSTVCVRDGAIAAIVDADEVVSAAELVDLGDDALLPGLVDTHVHVNEPGRTDWEGFATATSAAAAGGITTIIDMPLNSLPPTTTAAALEAKQAAAADRCHVDVGFWGGAVPGNERDLEELHDAGVFGFKAFMADSGVAEFPPCDADTLERVAAVCGRLGALLIVHAESAAVLQRQRPPAGRAYRDFLRSRPPEAEQEAVAELVALAERHGTRVHVLHLSAAAAAATLEDAQARGLPITAETCPHYLCLAAEDVPDGATAFKCCPPIRGASNRERLWEALADGTIGCVVSDHSPCPPALKRLDDGDFGAAWGGVASLELGLSAVWTQAHRRGHTLDDVARWMATGPARLAGLAAKGVIEVGVDADLVWFAPAQPRSVEPTALRQRHPLTPYAGARLDGAVRGTWLRGVPIGGTPRGRLLDRPSASREPATTPRPEET